MNTVTMTKPHDICIGLQAERIALTALHDLEARMNSQFRIWGYQKDLAETLRFRSEFVCCSTTPTGRLRFQLGFHASGKIKRDDLLKRLVEIETRAQADDAIQARRIPVKCEVFHRDGQAPMVSLKGTRLLNVEGKFYHVGAVARGQAGRKVQGGPLVLGPWAFAVQKATVLHGEGYEAIKAADGAEREAALVLNVGGLVRVDGVDYRVRRADPYGNIDLVEEAA